MDAALRRISGQARHHLKNKLKSGCPDQAGSVFHIRSCMPAVSILEHFITKRLRTEFNRLHSVAVQAG